jgi:hypothetical protein
MELGEGILYRGLSIERDFDDCERWKGHSVVMTCTEKTCHILEVRSPTKNDEVPH